MQNCGMVEEGNIIIRTFGEKLGFLTWSKEESIR